MKHRRLTYEMPDDVMFTMNVPLLSRTQVHERLLALVGDYDLLSETGRSELALEIAIATRAWCAMWRPITDGGYHQWDVLLAVQHNPTHQVHIIGKWNAATGMFETTGGLVARRDVLAWMPLPPLGDIDTDLMAGREQLRAQAIAKLTPEEREACGL